MILSIAVRTVHPLHTLPCGQVFNPLYTGDIEGSRKHVSNTDQKVLERIHNTYPGKIDFTATDTLSFLGDTLVECPYM